MCLSKDQRYVSPFKNPLVHWYLQLQPPVFIVKSFPFPCLCFLCLTERALGPLFLDRFSSSFSFVNFIYLAVSDLSGSRRDLLLHHVGSFVTAPRALWLQHAGLAASQPVGP